MDIGHVEFRLLGEVAVWAAGQPLDVGTPRQQAVLAALLVDARRPVAVETLIDRVWADGTPTEARNVLYSHLSRIRRLLRQVAGGAVAHIERRHAGYVLDVDPDLVDLHRFRRLVEQGRDPRGDDAARSAALHQALALWRGRPLAALTGQWAAQVRASCDQQRLDAAMHWARAELNLGHPATVLGVLPDLVAEHPLVEPLEGLLMRALHAAGRGAEALDRYSGLRQRLADQLGTDPSEEMRTLHQALLRGELPAVARPEPVTVAPALATPAQLPQDVSCFAGRDRELHRLDALLAEPGTTTMIVIDGTAGIGKTALAVRWAHRVAGRFPDGQLYLNLRGFDPTGSPVTAAEALRALLDGFEVPADRIPAGLEAQAGLYRSLLATRKVLVLLDNARDAEQVRPLLPGSPGCLAAVTSRNQLASLVAAGAHPVTLELLTTTEARELLARRLGGSRVTAEPQAVDAIITACTRLPLALSIVAARAAIHPRFGLAVLADELREATGRLDELASADPAIDARAVFSWSYRQLSPAAARVFRLLGLHSGPDVATPAAASLAGIPVAKVRPLLAELARAHLVAEHVPGRFACHDLLRAYAAEQTLAIDTDPERSAAIGRGLDHYVHSGYHADRLLNPHPDDVASPTQPPPGITLEHLAGRAQALAWFTAEQPVMLAAIRQSTGLDAQVWQLARTLRRFLSYQGRWHDSIDALSAALEAARRLGDPLQQAYAHRFLGGDYIALGCYEKARPHLDQARDLYSSAGDTVGEAHVHRYFSWMLDRQGLHREAIGYARRALDLFRAAGHRAGQARALNAIGWFHALLGDYEEALHHCRLALELQERFGDRFGQAETWDSLGYANHHLGRHAEAVGCYRTARDLYHEFDDRYNEADTSASLGDAHFAAGDTESACAAWQHALGILDQLGHPAAEEVRHRLKAGG
ncbi:SARP family transcriptional regulator [Rhizocola hellebori]|uniref:SARP family transcriptional regulator n=1 Tax=Rhizocola hellebori TaxID=1392758 RepID=A0A8J3VHB4_9ACTN|nr:BTAD domain-containing putative transcriptional regulator [Rhizocola hellebori]GIH06072.1 SARP family transcriptional regulator [Rhizocola hellebori]